MPTIYKNGKRYGGTSDTAINVNYDNTNSNLESTTVQEVIDEVDGKIENKEDKFYQTLDSVKLNDYVEPIRAICTWCSNVPKNDECGSKGRLEVAVDYDGTVHQRYSMFALDGSENYAGIYERYKSSGDNYDTNGGWSEWTKVSAPLANDLTQDVPGLALDAAQGKVLNDKITQLNSDIANIKDGTTSTPTNVTSIFYLEPNGTDPYTNINPIKNMRGYSLYIFQIDWWYTPRQTLVLRSLPSNGKVICIYDPTNNTPTNITIVDDEHIRVDNPVVGKEVGLWGIK